MNGKARSTSSGEDREGSTTSTTDPHPDSVRLDWLEFQGCIELSLNKSGMRPAFFDVSQGDHTRGRGYSLRAAIDEALARELAVDPSRSTPKTNPDDA